MSSQLENFWHPVRLVTAEKTFEFPLPENNEQWSYGSSEGLSYEAQAIRQSLLKGETSRQWLRLMGRRHLSTKETPPPKKNPKKQKNPKNNDSLFPLSLIWIVHFCSAQSSSFGKHRNDMIILWALIQYQNYAAKINK